MSFLSNLFDFKNKGSHKVKTPKDNKLTIKCPYCGDEVIPIPTRKKKCLNCNQHMIV